MNSRECIAPTVWRPVENRDYPEHQQSALLLEVWKLTYFPWNMQGRVHVPQVRAAVW